MNLLAIDFTFQPLPEALTWVQGLGAWGGVAFIGLYVVATIAFFPASVLTLGAGVVFGWFAGSVYVFAGATLGSIAAFAIGRYLLRSWVAQRIAGNQTFAAIDTAVGKEGFKIVLLTRLSPIFPFNLLNYAYGITQVSLKDYALAGVGMIPGTLMYVYLGSLFGNLAALFAGEQRSNPAELVLSGVGLVATIGVTLYVTRLARRALNEKIPAPERVSEK